MELDLIIETPHEEVIGIEIKSKPTPIEADFASALSALKRLKPKARCLCVCTGSAARKAGNYDVLPYSVLLKELSEL